MDKCITFFPIFTLILLFSLTTIKWFIEKTQENKGKNSKRKNNNRKNRKKRKNNKDQDKQIEYPEVQKNNKIKINNCRVNGTLDEISIEQYEHIIIGNGNPCIDIKEEQLLDNHKTTLYMDTIKFSDVDIVHDIQKYLITDKLHGKFNKILIHHCSDYIIMEKHYIYNSRQDGKPVNNFNDYTLHEIFWKNIILMLKNNGIVILNSKPLINNFVSNSGQCPHALVISKMKEIGIFITDIKEIPTYSTNRNAIIEIKIDIDKSLRKIIYNQYTDNRSIILKKKHQTQIKKNIQYKNHNLIDHNSLTNGTLLNSIEHINKANNIIICSGIKDIFRKRKEPFNNKKTTVCLDIAISPHVHISHDIKKHLIDKRLYQQFDRILMEKCPWTIFAEKECIYVNGTYENNYKLYKLFWINLVLMLHCEGTGLIMMDNFTLLMHPKSKRKIKTHVNIFEQKLNYIGIYLRCRTYKFDSHQKLSELILHVNVKKSLLEINRKYKNPKKKDYYIEGLGI